MQTLSVEAEVGHYKTKILEIRERHQRSSTYVGSQRGDCKESYNYTRRHKVYPTGAEKQKNQHTNTRHKIEP